MRYLINLIICTTFLSCLNQQPKSNFNDEFFNNPRTIYYLREHSNNNQINIWSNSLISKSSIFYKKDSIEINISKEKQNSDYILKQITINKDLGFVVFWKNKENKAIWFFLNKGKKTMKWDITEVLEKTKM